MALRILLIRGRFFYCLAEDSGLWHVQNLLAGFLAMRSRRIAKGFSDQRMHRISQLLRNLPDLFEQREIRWVSDIGWDARGVNQQG
jgi:hypothetical protein